MEQRLEELTQHLCGLRNVAERMVRLQLAWDEHGPQLGPVEVVRRSVQRAAHAAGVAAAVAGRLAGDRTRLRSSHGPAGRWSLPTSADERLAGAAAASDPRAGSQRPSHALPRDASYAIVGANHCH